MILARGANASSLPVTLAEYDDSSDVHHNSTIVSHAAYAMAQALPVTPSARSGIARWRAI